MGLAPGDVIFERPFGVTATGAARSIAGLPDTAVEAKAHSPPTRKTPAAITRQGQSPEVATCFSW